MLQIVSYSDKAIAVIGDTRAIKDTLKALGGRFNSRLTCGAGWIFSAKKREEVTKVVQGGNITKEKKTTEKTNKYGVKVGDLFKMTWGYDQTNNDFFQVVSLCGSNSVRVRCVCPKLLGSKAVSGMSENRKFEIPQNGELLPVDERSVFIKDSERGDIKRLQSYGDGICYINIDGHHAHRIAGESVTVYESWYA